MNQNIPDACSDASLQKWSLALWILQLQLLRRTCFEPLPINIWWLLLQHFVFPGSSPLSMGWCSSSLFKTSIRGDFHLIYCDLMAERAFFGRGMHQGHWVVNGTNRWKMKDLQQCTGHTEPDQRQGRDSAVKAHSALMWNFMWRNVAWSPHSFSPSLLCKDREWAESWRFF